MVMKDRKNVRRAESVGLKRKLTGPLNLLLPGKTRSRSEGEEPPEEVENETTARRSGIAVERGAELKEGSGMEGEAPPTGTCRGRCRNRRTGRWWRWFSSELICIRRIKKKVEKRPEEQQKYSEVEPQSQEKSINKRAWPKFRKSWNSSDQQREEVQGEARKRLHRFFIRGRNRRPQEDTAAVGVAQTDAVQATVIVETSVHKELQSLFQSSSSSLQAPANSPFIQIELCPQEEEEQEEEKEEECWEGSSSSQNHLLLHLLGFDHSERRLLQTAHTLVQAAVNAAVDQLTREQQSKCDHA